jgi:hypothetical protein
MGDLGESSSKMREGEVEVLRRRLERGIATGMPAVSDAVALDVVLGIDFGTSSTKIVARLPYQAGSPAFAVPVILPAQAEHHVHMWESRLWMMPDGAFSLLEEPDGVALTAIKASLMAQECERRMVLHVGAISATALECAIAFLALQIRQARGWLYGNHEKSLTRGPLRWHYNVGLPAAKLDAYRGKPHYQTCLAAAIEVAGTAGAISLDLVRKTLSRISRPEVLLREQNATLQPEIAAAVAGFAHSRKREDGLYAMIDIGAGTMDSCTFSLRATGDGEDLCPIFAADVSMLGIQRLDTCGNDTAALSAFGSEVNERICGVLRPTRSQKFPSSPRWKNGLPVFLAGGGRPSQLHRAELGKIHDNMRHAGLGGLRIQELPPPEDLEHLGPVGDLHRLAVAVGLSLPAVDIPLVELPSNIGDIPPMSRRDYESGFIEKDMV